jgi:hypothetical protein
VSPARFGWAEPVATKTILYMAPHSRLSGTLRRALDEFRLCVLRVKALSRLALLGIAPGIEPVYGILTRADVERHYRP